jgi:hypothetical protein
LFAIHHWDITVGEARPRVDPIYFDPMSGEPMDGPA